MHRMCRSSGILRKNDFGIVSLGRKRGSKLQRSMLISMQIGLFLALLSLVPNSFTPCFNWSQHAWAFATDDIIDTQQMSQLHRPAPGPVYPNASRITAKVLQSS